MYLQPITNASVKVVFVGSERSGKTSLIKRCIGGSWDAISYATNRSNLTFWPIQSSRGPVECLETLPTRDKKSKVNDLTFEQSREKPIDHPMWTNWGDVFVFVYSTESMESYLESYSLLKNWIAYKANRTITPVAATSRSLPLKWAEVSSKSGENITQMQEWIYEVWDALKARERAIHLHCVSQLSNLISTKHSKGGSLVISLDTVGRCLRHGVLLKVTKRGFKQETPCFLFEKVLLFCKVANKGTFSVKKAVLLNLAVLTDSTRPAGDYAFELHQFGSKDSSSGSSSGSKSSNKSESSIANSWQLLALGQADKDSWMDALTHAIKAFTRDAERAKHYSSIKSLALSSRPVQRQGRRQIGLPWSLLATNASSGVPIVVESITNYLNLPSTNNWGTFFLPGVQAEHKILSERVNRMDPFNADFVSTSTGGTSSSSSISGRSSSISSPTQTHANANSNATPAGGPRDGAVASSAISGSPTSSGSHSAATASQATSTGVSTNSNEKSIDMTGITPITAAEFLLGFLNASPSFIPVGFFTFLMQSCQDVSFNSSTGSQHLKTAFAMLPLAIFRTLARLMFNIQQSVLNSADDSTILKAARYLVPILVKDTVELEKLNYEKLLLIVQSMVREADAIFSLPFELVPSTSPLESSSSGTLRRATVVIGPDALATFSASNWSGPSGTPNSSQSLSRASFMTSPTSKPSIDADFFNSSSPLTTGSVGLLDAYSGGGGQSPVIGSPLSLEDGIGDSQSSISALLRGVSSDLRTSNSGNVTSQASSASSAQNMKRLGNFVQLTRVPSDSAQLEGIGPLNSDQVMSRVARARAVMAELLDLLKSVEHLMTAPEIEAVLQSLVITCNSLSRYSWDKYQEMIETDTLDEFVFLIEIFHKHFKASKGTSVDKVLKSKQTRSTLGSLCNDMQNLLNQFTTRIAGLKGYEQARPAGDRPKPVRSAKGEGSGIGLSNLLANGGSNGSNADLDGIASGSTFAYGSTGALTMRGDSLSSLPSGLASFESGTLEDGTPLDLSSLSAKQWWSYVFGQHSLRAATDKFLAELLAVSRSSVASQQQSDSSSTGVSLGSSIEAGSASALGGANSLTSGQTEIDGSESQPASPRVTADKTEYPLLELSEKEKKALALFFDQQQTGFVNLLKFSQFLKAFGSITSCVEAAIQLIRAPYYYGYLSSLESVRLLETEMPGTFLFCFENNDPSNWNIHWIDDMQTHRSLAIDATPGDYMLKPSKGTGSGLTPSTSLLSIQASNPTTPLSESPVSSCSNPALPTSGDDASVLKLSVGDSGSVASPATPFSDSEQTASSPPKIQITVQVAPTSLEDSPMSSYGSLQAAIESRPHDWKRALKLNLYSLPFFYGDISESEGMRALKNQPIGTYLVIFSAQKPFVLDCLYVTPEERVGHLYFTRTMRLESSEQSAQSSPEDASSIASSDGGNAMFFLGVEKDGVSVQLESGETFANLSDALRHHSNELKSALTQKKSSGHVAMGSVHEGSLEKLVAYLYDDVVDLAYITAFLLTYRSFTQPATLLEELMAQYRHLDTIPNGKPYQMRLVNFFKIWLSDFSWDLVSAQETVLTNIMAFVHSDISVRFPSITKQLQTNATKVSTERAQQQHQQQLAAQQSSDSSSFVFSSPLPTPQTYEEPSKALEYSPADLAEQMFSFEFELFSKIQPFELMGNGWMKADKQTRAPNIVRMVAKSNLLGSWVVSEILKESVLKKRAALIEHFIAVADESYKRNNFHSAMVLMSALHDSSIVRLKLTWEKVSKKAKESLENIEQKMDDDDNFSQYRSAYLQAPPPKLPYMGLVFRDLIHIEDGSPKHLPNGAINFHRCELIAEKLHMIKLSQQDRLPWPKNEDLWLYIRNFPKHPDPQSQYQRSLELEPRAGGGPSVGGSGMSPHSSPTMRSANSAILAREAAAKEAAKQEKDANGNPPIVVTFSSGDAQQVGDANSKDSASSSGSSSRRGSTRGVSVFSPATASSNDVSGTVSTSSTTELGTITTTSPASSIDNGGGLGVPPQSARSAPSALATPLQDSSPNPNTGNTNGNNNACQEHVSSPDSSKWSGSTSKGKSKSALNSVMGFMRKK